MKEDKTRKQRRPAAKSITSGPEQNRESRRRVEIGDVVIPKKGVWAGDQCLVLEVKERPQPSVYYRMVRVLLPNQHERSYPISEIGEIIPAKGPVPVRALQKERDVVGSKQKLNMEVVMRHVSGAAEDNLERAKQEVTRVLDFRGDVVSGRIQGRNIIVAIAISPKWDASSQEKINYLKEWIPAKVRTVFEVVSVSTGQNA